MLSSYLALWMMAQASAAPLPAAPTDCWQPKGAARVWVDTVKSLGGKELHRIALPPLPDQAVVVQVIEQGIDVSVELLDAQNRRLTRVESPVIRTGVAVSLVEAQASRPRMLVLNGKEHAGHRGAVRVRVFAAQTPCVDPLRLQSQADARYAAANASAAAPERQARESSPQAYAQAAQLYETIAATPGPATKNLAILQLALASVHYYALSQWTASAEWATKAATTADAAGDPYTRARAQAILAATWLESHTANTAVERRKQFDEARKLLGSVRDFHAGRHEDYDAALQTNNIGLAYFYEARFEEAMPYFAAAQASFKRQFEIPREALAMQNTALCEWGLGNLPTALERFGHALALMDSRAHPDLFLIIINNQALAYYSAGKYDKALVIFQRALEFAQRVQEDSYRARSYYGIGITQYALGDRRLATQFLRMALDVWKGELDVRGRTSALRALAVIEHEEKQFDEAIRLNIEARQLASSATARARIEVKIAASREALGQRAQAIEMLRPLIDAPPDDNALVQAEARLERGRILRSSGDFTNAEPDLERALAVFRALQSLSGEFDSLFELARVRAFSGRERDALRTITAALALGDEMGAQTANPEYRAALIQSLRPAQELMVDVLHRRYVRAFNEGRTADVQRIAIESLAFADETRAQSFDRILAQRFERAGNAELNRLIQERERLHRALADRRLYLATREDRADPNDPRARVLREDIARLRVELGNTNTEIARASESAASSGKVAGQKSLDLSRVPANQAFVEYWLGATYAYAWVVRDRQVHWVNLGAGPAIAESARRLHEVMHDFSTTPLSARVAAASRLHRFVIAPIATLLQGADALAIAADGPLHVVPFAALRTTETDQYLVQRHSIAFVPAFRFLAPALNTPVNRRTSDKALIVADPIYQRDDPRLSVARSGAPAHVSAPPQSFHADGGLRNLPRLPASAREAAAVRHALRGVPVMLLEGADATRSTFLSQDLASYRYIHIAAHGVIDTEVPRLSALILGAYDLRGAVIDQLVRADDLLTATFDADLVTLSACSTSLGTDFAGEGPVGLRYAVLARGARSVVSSLWPVADETTADLMTEMYGELNSKAIRPDSALTFAMRRLLDERPTLDPALWAPYTVHLANQQERKQ